MSVVTEIGAGTLLVIGLLTPLACAAVISVMLIAGLLAHRPNGFFVFKDGYEYVLALSVVCLAIAAVVAWSKKGLRTRLRLDKRYGWTPTTRLRGYDSERRDKPMIPMITALASSRGADRV